MRYIFDDETNENKIRFRNLCNGEIFRLGSTLYIKTPEIELRDEYSDDLHYFNAVDLRYGERKYIEQDDTIERYIGEMMFRQDDFISTFPKRGA